MQILDECYIAHIGWLWCPTFCLPNNERCCENLLKFVKVVYKRFLYDGQTEVQWEDDFWWWVVKCKKLFSKNPQPFLHWLAQKKKIFELIYVHILSYRCNKPQNLENQLNKARLWHFTHNVLKYYGTFTHMNLSLEISLPLPLPQLISLGHDHHHPLTHARFSPPM